MSARRSSASSSRRLRAASERGPSRRSPASGRGSTASAATTASGASLSLALPRPSLERSQPAALARGLSSDEDEPVRPAKDRPEPEALASSLAACAARRAAAMKSALRSRPSCGWAPERAAPIGAAGRAPAGRAAGRCGGTGAAAPAAANGISARGITGASMRGCACWRTRGLPEPGSSGRSSSGPGAGIMATRVSCSSAIRRLLIEASTSWTLSMDSRARRSELVAASIRRWRSPRRAWATSPPPAPPDCSAFWISPRRAKPLSAASSFAASAAILSSTCDSTAASSLAAPRFTASARSRSCASSSVTETGWETLSRSEAISRRRLSNSSPPADVRPASKRSLRLAMPASRRAIRSASILACCPSATSVTRSGRSRALILPSMAASRFSSSVKAAS